MVAGMVIVPKCNKPSLRISKGFMEKTFANGKICTKKCSRPEIRKCFINLLASVRAHFLGVEISPTCDDHVFKPLLDTIRHTLSTQNVKRLLIALHKFSSAQSINQSYQ